VDDFRKYIADIKDKLFKYQTEKRSKTYLALNENPYPFPEKLIEEVYKLIDPYKIPTYYDSPDEELLNLLLEYINSDKLSVKNLSIGNGADEIIYYLLLMFKEMKVTIFPPTYSCYKLFAKDIGSKVISIPLKEEKIPINEIENLLNVDSIVFIPNPNNPTGHFFEDEEIEFLLNTGALVIIDEAYYEFGKRSYIDWIDEYKNLVVIRTFSKAFSLAAQRIGYLVANEDLIDAYNRIRLPFNVDYVSQLFARVALKNLEFFRKRIEEIINEREKMKKELMSLGYKISNSQGNFVFMYLDTDSKEVLTREFEKKKIAIRKFSEGLRITIGTPKQNEMVLRIFMEVKKNENSKN